MKNGEIAAGAVFPKGAAVVDAVLLTRAIHIAAAVECDVAIGSYSI